MTLDTITSRDVLTVALVIGFLSWPIGALRGRNIASSYLRRLAAVGVYSAPIFLSLIVLVLAIDWIPESGVLSIVGGSFLLIGCWAVATPLWKLVVGAFVDARELHALGMAIVDGRVSPGKV